MACKNQTVMAMYEKAKTVVRMMHGNSKEFEVKVGVLTPLLFVIVILMQDVSVGLLWDLLYADDLVFIAEWIEELKEKVLRWKECMLAKGLPG